MGHDIRTKLAAVGVPPTVVSFCVYFINSQKKLAHSAVKIWKHFQQMCNWSNNKKREHRPASWIKDLKQFKQMSDLIVANRINDEIKDVIYKVYTRDLFNLD